MNSSDKTSRNLIWPTNLKIDFAISSFIAYSCIFISYVTMQAYFLGLFFVLLLLHSIFHIQNFAATKVLNWWLNFYNLCSCYNFTVFKRIYFQYQNRSMSQQGTPVSISIGLKIHSTVSSQALIQYLFKLGIYI